MSSRRSRASRSATASTWPGGPGSEVHDEIFWSRGRAAGIRATNRAGGLEGGITNGEPLVVRAAMKPIATLTSRCARSTSRPSEPAAALERSDVSAVPAAGVVGEAMVALVARRRLREKFGGDHIDDVLAARSAYKERIGWRR